MGAGTLLKYTDDNKFEAPLRLVKKADLRDSLPKDIAKGVSRIIGIGMTWDGNLAIVAPGSNCSNGPRLQAARHVAHTR